MPQFFPSPLGAQKFADPAPTACARKLMHRLQTRIILVTLPSHHSNIYLAMKHIVAATLLGSSIFGTASAAGPEASLIIRNHRFEPTEVKVPAGQHIKLVVDNRDSTPEEFESHTLNREKVIPGGAKATIYIGPLKPGRYDFFGEYNEATAKGAIVAE